MARSILQSRAEYDQKTSNRGLKQIKFSDQNGNQNYSKPLRSAIIGGLRTKAAPLPMLNAIGEKNN
jgi:hypothetical protein